jgi:pilus assembly protein CpaB
MARSVAGGAAPSRLNRKFLVVAVLLAVLSAVLVYAKISATSTTDKTSVAPGSESVVVAKAAIQPRTLITADQLEVKSVPANAILSGAYTTVTEAVGKTAKFPIQANGQITTSNVIDTSKPATDAALSLLVPAGKRAMSIQTSQVANAGGLILPGDFVDLVWTCCSGTPIIAKTILRNIQVAAVAQTVVNSGPVVASTPGAGDSSAPVASGASKPVPDAQTVTLLLTPQESEQVFLAEQNGTLRADLRGVSDQDTTDPGLVKLFDLLPPTDLAGIPDTLKPNGYKAGQ